MQFTFGHCNASVRKEICQILDTFNPVQLTSYRSGQIRMSLHHHNDVTEPSWTVSRRGVNLGDIDTPTDVAYVRRNILAVSELQNQRVQLFRADGSSLLTIGEGDLEPWGLVVDDIDDNLAVVDARDRNVKFYTCNGDLVSTWKKNMFRKPRGLTVTRDDHFVVTDVCHQEDQKVHVCTPEGKLLHTFGSRDRNSPQHLDCPHYITSDRSNHLIISDYVNHVVKVFTLEGDLIRTIGGKGSQDGQLYFPTGVTTDQIDNIIIVDNGNHRVSMFSPEGEFLEHLLCDQDGVQWPEAIALSEDDMMAITEYTLDTDAVKTFHLNF